MDSTKPRSKSSRRKVRTTDANEDPVSGKGPRSLMHSSGRNEAQRPAKRDKTKVKGKRRAKVFDEAAYINALSGVSANEKENRLLIASIRKNWGVGREEVVVSYLHEALQRALSTLSTDINTSDTNFLLELVQNADDNTYDDNVQPTLSVVLSVAKESPNGPAVYLHNNEVGFSKENVSALCNIGMSTKKKKLGFIGEKGIGFKSVFLITDEPYISSNGFSFKFSARMKSKSKCVSDEGAPDDVSAGLGFIVPEWVENHPIPVPEGWTSIYMPLRDDILVDDLVNGLMARTEHTLLLFLRKLEVIKTTCPGRAVLRFEKKYLSDANIVHIEETIHDLSETESGASTGTCAVRSEPSSLNQAQVMSQVKSSTAGHNFLCSRHVLDVPESALQDGRRHVSETEIVLAFPLCEAMEPIAEAQKVYAFLPVAPYGFRFLIQADWLLTSNREDLKKGDACLWNKWLRSEIPHAFVKSLAVFKEYTTLQPTLATAFLDYLPVYEYVEDGQGSSKQKIDSLDKDVDKDVDKELGKNKVKEGDKTKSKAKIKEKCKNKVKTMEDVEKHPKQVLLFKSYHTAEKSPDNGMHSRDVTDSFFQPVVASLHSMLQRTECILTESGRWFLPCNTLIPTKGAQEVVSSSDLMELFGMDYITNHVNVERHERLLTSLGCMTLQPFHVYEVARARASRRGAEGKAPTQEDISWHAAVYLFLSRFESPKEFLKSQSLLPLFLLEDGSLVNAPSSEEPIFVPVEKRSFGFEKAPLSGYRCLSAATLKVDAYGGDVKSQKRVFTFLKALGFLEGSAANIFNAYLIPLYRNLPIDTDGMLTVGDGEAVGKWHWMLSATFMFTIANVVTMEREAPAMVQVLKLRTRSDSYRPVSTTYLSSKYLFALRDIGASALFQALGSSDETSNYLCQALEVLFDGFPVPFLHSQYLKTNEPGRMAEVLIKLGANVVPRIERKIETVSRRQGMESGWPSCDPQGFEVSSGHLSEEMRWLMKKKPTELLMFLDKTWSRVYESPDIRNIVVKYKVRERERQFEVRDGLPPFVEELQEMLVPTSRGEVKISDTFTERYGLSSVMETSVVAIIRMQLEDEALIEAMGVSKHLNVDAVKKCLLQLSEREPQEGEVGIVFREGLVLFIELYEQLQQYSSGHSYAKIMSRSQAQQDINDFFRSNAVLFIPERRLKVTDNDPDVDPYSLPVAGRFINSRKPVFWTLDNEQRDSGVFREEVVCLDAYYPPRLEQFFITAVGVNKTPSPSMVSSFIQAILTEWPGTSLSAASSSDIERVRKKMLACYRYVAGCLKDAPLLPEAPVVVGPRAKGRFQPASNYQEQYSWLNKLMEKPMFLVKRTVLDGTGASSLEFKFSLGTNVIVNDDRSLASLFSSSVPLLAIPRRELPRLYILLKAANCKYLSQVVSCNILGDVRNAREDQVLTKKVRDALPFVSQYLYQKVEATSLWDFVLEQPHEGSIAGLVVLSMANLQVQYTLQRGSKTVLSQPARRPALSTRTDRTFYGQGVNVPTILIDGSQHHNTDAMAVELASLLEVALRESDQENTVSLPDTALEGLVSFSALLLSKRSTEQMVELMETRGIYNARWDQNMESDSNDAEDTTDIENAELENDSQTDEGEGDYYTEDESETELTQDNLLESLPRFDPESTRGSRFGDAYPGATDEILALLGNLAPPTSTNARSQVAEKQADDTQVDSASGPKRGVLRINGLAESKLQEEAPSDAVDHFPEKHLLESDASTATAVQGDPPSRSMNWSAVVQKGLGGQTDQSGAEEWPNLIASREVRDGGRFTPVGAAALLVDEDVPLPRAGDAVSHTRVTEDVENSLHNELANYERNKDVGELPPKSMDCEKGEDVREKRVHPPAWAADLPGIGSDKTQANTGTGIWGATDTTKTHKNDLEALPETQLLSATATSVASAGEGDSQMASTKVEVSAFRTLESYMKPRDFAAAQLNQEDKAEDRSHESEGPFFQSKLPIDDGGGGGLGLNESIDAAGMKVCIAEERRRAQEMIDQQPGVSSLTGSDLVFDCSTPEAIHSAAESNLHFRTALVHLVEKYRISAEYPGFDLLVLKPYDKGVSENPIDRVIELKSSTLVVQFTEMTNNEFLTAQRVGDLFWLYCIFGLGTSVCVMRRFQNPCSQLSMQPSRHSVKLSSYTKCDDVPLPFLGELKLSKPRGKGKKKA